ncbi:MAG: hypothetical protein ACRDHJ_01360 [Actinomycetota bacterium]
MLARRVIPLMMAGLTACAALGPAGPTTGSDRVLVLGSSHGVVSVDPGSGSVLFQGSGVPSSSDWSTLFTAIPDAGGTILQSRDSATGEALSSLPVTGELAVRVATPDGSLVALMPPLPAGASPWVPEPRSSTTITVADPSGLQEPRQFRLDGNFEPDAFSADRGTLFLISYVPPTAPTGYRVAALDLSDGSVSRVKTGVKGVAETMSGTRLEQVASADGSMLYTLYTTRPPDQVVPGTESADHVGFVHTLSLEQGWAHCVPLPEELWGGDPADQAMAISADGDLLYVVDTASRVVAVMDTASLEMTAREGVELAPDREGETRAVIGPEGALVVSSGPDVVSLDAETLSPIGGWTFEASVVALGTGAGEIYVAVPGAVHAVSPGGDRADPKVRAPVVDDLSYVGMLER